MKMEVVTESWRLTKKSTFVAPTLMYGIESKMFTSSYDGKKERPLRVKISKNGSNFEVYVFWIANIEHFGTSDTLLITDSFLESIVDFRICGDHKELLPEVLNNFV